MSREEMSPEERAAVIDVDIGNMCTAAVRRDVDAIRAAVLADRAETTAKLDALAAEWRAVDHREYADGIGLAAAMIRARRTL